MSKIIILGSKPSDDIILPQSSTPVVDSGSTKTLSGSEDKEIVLPQPEWGNVYVPGEEVTILNPKKRILILPSNIGDGGTGAGTGDSRYVRYDGAQYLTIDQQLIARTNIDAEQSFSKNNAFNKTFGTGSGDVVEGNDTRLLKAYNDHIVGISVSGDTTKTIELTQNDGGKISANFDDNNNYASSLYFETDTGNLVLGRSGLSSLTRNLDGRYMLPTDVNETLDSVTDRGNTTNNQIETGFHRVIGPGSYLMALRTSGGGLSTKFSFEHQHYQASTFFESVNFNAIPNNRIAGQETSRFELGVRNAGGYKVLTYRNTGLLEINKIRLYDGAQNGYILKSSSSGEGSWQPESNNYLKSGAFANGVITLQREGLSDVVIDTKGYYIPLSQKGIANGVATLDGNVRVPNAQMPLEPVFDKVTINNIATNPSDAVRLDQLNSAILGQHWQPSVEDILITPPGSPSLNQRYIVNNNATGAWSGHDDDIAQWNGSGWDFYTPTEGWTVWVKDVDQNYNYNGTDWVRFGTTVTHNNLTGLQGGTFHLSQDQYDSVTAGIANWNQAYNNYITGVSVVGTSQKTITLTQRDGGTISTSFTDYDTNNYLKSGIFESTTGNLKLDREGLSTLEINMDGRYALQSSLHNPVTLDRSDRYLTLTDQRINVGLINLASHVTGITPVANGGTGINNFDPTNIARTNVANTFSESQAISSASFKLLELNRSEATGGQAIRYTNNVSGWDLLGTEEDFLIRSLNVPIAVKEIPFRIKYGSGNVLIDTHVDSGDPLNVGGSINSTEYKILSKIVIDASRNFNGGTGTFSGDVSTGDNLFVADGISISGSPEITFFNNSGDAQMFIGMNSTNYTQLRHESYDNTFRFTINNSGSFISDLLTVSTSGIDITGITETDNLTITGLSHTNGQLLSIGAGGVISAVDAPSVDLSNYVTKDGIQTITGPKTFTQDIEVRSAKVGNLTSTTSIFGHKDHFNGTDFALLQNSLGDTYLNSPTGRNLELRQGGTKAASIGILGLDVVKGGTFGDVIKSTFDGTNTLGVQFINSDNSKRLYDFGSFNGVAVMNVRNSNTDSNEITLSGDGTGTFSGDVKAANMWPVAYATLTGTTVSHDTKSTLNTRITLTGDTTITFTNLVNGMSGNIVVIQDATGGHSLTLSPTPDVIDGGNGTIPLTGTAGSKDIISWTYDGVDLNVTYGPNYN